MSLVSCLESQNSKRFNKESGPRLCCGGGYDRSWSGNLTPPPYESRYDQIHSGSTTMTNLTPPPYESRYDQMHSGPITMTTTNKIIRKNQHRRLHSTGACAFDGRNADNGEPRLLRSGGMRRDWSFEDLKQRREELQLKRINDETTAV